MVVVCVVEGSRRDGSRGEIRVTMVGLLPQNEFKLAFGKVKHVEKVRLFADIKGTASTLNSQVL